MSESKQERRIGSKREKCACKHYYGGEGPHCNRSGCDCTEFKGTGVWELRVYKGKDALKASKDNYSSVTFHGTGRQSTKELARLANLVEESKGGSDMPLSALLETWLIKATPLLSVTTVPTYRTHIDTKIVPALGHVSISKLTEHDFDQFFSGLHEKGLADATILKVFYICSKALKQAVRYGWIARNPLENIEKPRIGKWHRDLPSWDEAIDFLERVEKRHPEMGRLWFTMLVTGMRRGEAVGLQRRDVNLRTGEIKLRRQIVELAGGQLVEKGLKWDSQREFSIGGSALQKIVAQLNELDDRAARAGRVIKPTSYVWSDSLDGHIPWRPTRLTAYFVKMAKADESDQWPGVDLRLHDLRHLNGTYLSDSGVDLATIANRLGHARISTTANYYVQRVNESDKAAAAAIEDLLRVDEELLRADTVDRSE